MPRKKPSEAPSPEISPAKIPCPACKSEISADGATLHARSEYFEDLLEKDAVVEKLEKLVTGYEAKLAAAKQELAAKAAVQTKPEEKKDGTMEQGQGKQRGGTWW
jgi:hypothetical protein